MASRRLLLVWLALGLCACGGRGGASGGGTPPDQVSAATPADSEPAAADTTPPGTATDSLLEASEPGPLEPPPLLSLESGPAAQEPPECASDEQCTLANSFCQCAGLGPDEQPHVCLSRVQPGQSLRCEAIGWTNPQARCVLGACTVGPGCAVRLEAYGPEGEGRPAARFAEWANEAAGRVRTCCGQALQRDETVPGAVRLELRVGADGRAEATGADRAEAAESRAVLLDCVTGAFAGENLAADPPDNLGYVVRFELSFVPVGATERRGRRPRRVPCDPAYPGLACTPDPPPLPFPPQ